MGESSRRTVLHGMAGFGIAGLVSLGGCLGTPSDPATRDDSESDRTPASPDTESDGETDPPTAGDCSASDPPSAADAGVQPRDYPPRPDPLTLERTRRFVERYERAYQYNWTVPDADYPERITVDVAVDDATVDDAGQESRFEISVSGYVNFERHVPEKRSSATAGSPGPTPSPLPSEHLVVETTYLVTRQLLRRDGVVVECW